ncbi:MAG TPA: hypothetical protein VD928_03740 [Candidatus Paceibacterota bacterium]|nr:hypothetical protein [Candidatus Paceibacterota bacterium]
MRVTQGIFLGPDFSKEENCLTTKCQYCGNTKVKLQAVSPRERHFGLPLNTPLSKMYKMVEHIDPNTGKKCEEGSGQHPNNLGPGHL